MSTDTAAADERVLPRFPVRFVSSRVVGDGPLHHVLSEPPRPTSGDGGGKVRERRGSEPRLLPRGLRYGCRALGLGDLEVFA
jgi:hypothetical protein